MLAQEAELVQPEQFSVPEYRRSLGEIVLCKGVYDLTHAGHVESLRLASLEGDSLVVALATDDSVRSRKGFSRPILKLQERIKIIRNLRMVDVVTTYDDATPFTVIKQIRPAVFCATHFDWLTQEQEEELSRYGVAPRILRRPDERSTSELIQAIIASVR